MCLGPPPVAYIILLVKRHDRTATKQDSVSTHHQQHKSPFLFQYLKNNNNDNTIASLFQILSKHQ
uniref:Uncharacterized protein n=1 Tax=Brassica oleracea var. oleracea TaxID=109376 RepID=A0A0D3AVE3_BRAOL